LDGLRFGEAGSHTTFSYSSTELAALTGARNYYRWIYRRLAPHIGRRVVEIGAGVGTFADLLVRHPHLEHLTLVEPAGNLFPVLRARFAEEPRVTLVHGEIDALPATALADTVILVNVLEHVDDDAGFLARLRTRLPPGGRLLVLAPAGPAVFGTLDRAFGHHRRYTAATLGGRLSTAGFAVESLRYFNLPGVLAWFIAGRILRKATLSARAVRIYDRCVVPWLAAVESVVPPPRGQSLVAVATAAARRP
jgi:SAM-dependent methyltransferase